MLENFNNFNPRQLRLNGRCPVCNSIYDFQRLQVLGEKDQSILVYMQCPACSTSMLSILSLDPRGFSTQGLVTDMALEEVSEFETSEPVASDQVLEMHQLLESDKNIFNE